MKQGFTLIELLVVVLIIGILSAVAVPQYQKAVEHARSAEALTLMAAMSESAQRYYDQHESWPSDFSQLDVEIPVFEGTSHGGKSFHLEFVIAVNDFVIMAIRRNPAHTYTLSTTITPQEDGSYSVVRSCDTGGPDEKAEEYCNIITGGKNSDF